MAGSETMPAWLAIILAILAPGGILAVLIERTRRENNRDHNANAAKLDRVIEIAEEARDEIKSHIKWHLGDPD